MKQQDFRSSFRLFHFFCSETKVSIFHDGIRSKQGQLNYLISSNIHPQTFTPSSWNQTPGLRTNTELSASSKWVWPYAALASTAGTVVSFTIFDVCSGWRERNKSDETCRHPSTLPLSASPGLCVSRGKPTAACKTLQQIAPVFMWALWTPNITPTQAMIDIFGKISLKGTN